jgi:hypothetical protein
LYGQKSNVELPKENKSSENKDVREKVWEQLKKSDKELIKGSWSNATVRKIPLQNSMGKIEETS